MMIMLFIDSEKYNLCFCSVEFHNNLTSPEGSIFICVSRVSQCLGYTFVPVRGGKYALI